MYINPALIPTVSPGNLFTRLTTDDTFMVRWLTPTDPCYFATLNRCPSDIYVAELVIAKSLDTVSLRLGHQSLFPFLIQPQIVSGSTVYNLPLSWIWDMHISVPYKWRKVRLAKIKRVSGYNPGSHGDEYTGKYRFVFTAEDINSSIETAIFQLDYEIDSLLDYQLVYPTFPTSSEESPCINPAETITINGWGTFRTLNPEDAEVKAIYDVMVPPTDQTVDSHGEYVNPSIYEIADTPAGGASYHDDYDLDPVSHGTGLLLPSAYNVIPAINSDVASWVSAFNYPFDSAASLASTTTPTITIPIGLFDEFNMTVPAPDQATGSLEDYPVWVSKIRRNDPSADSITIYFSTRNIITGSVTPIEFASLTLNRTDAAGRIAPVVAVENLWPDYAGNSDFMQGYGIGHAKLSSKWPSSTEIVDFFNSFIPILLDPADSVFSVSATRLSSYGLERIPITIPTRGQADALLGTAGLPSTTNKYVTEADQGLGRTVDFANESSLPPAKRENPSISRYGYTGALAHRVVKLELLGENYDYDTDVLPRLTILFGRPPIFGDQWYDGVRFKTFNSDSWIG